MRFNYFTLSLLLLFYFSSSFGQTLDYDYYDGKLYFKFLNESDKVISGLDDLRSGKHQEIQLVLDKYGVTTLERPFKVLKTPTFDRTYQMSFSDYTKVDELIKELEALPYMEYAERVPIMRHSYTPNDPNQGSQYYLDLINAEEAWDIHQGGNTTVAIVDDAVYRDHMDLADNIWVNPGEIPWNSIDDDGNGYVDDVYGWDASNSDPDPNPPSTATNSEFTHGTHCAGIASAVTDNNFGMASIGFNTKIIPVKGKADDDTGDGLPFIWDGFTYAVASGADIISCSWGGGGASTTEQNLVNTAHGNGQLVIAAAGNDNESAQHFPSAYLNVIAVASTNSADAKSGFSNYGEWVDISAPGTAIYSTLAGSSTSFGNQQGTSMACPMVAGLAALMKSVNPTMTNAEIESCLLSTAVDINDENPTYFGMLGAGRIDALAAMQCASSLPPVVLMSSSTTDVICPGETISFTDESLLNPESWNWTFQGGIPATSTEQNPTVYFPTPGVYDVILDATNEFGTSTKTFTAYVNVDGAVTGYAYYEDFESGNLFGWTVENPSAGTQWKISEITSGGEQYGNYALAINNYDENNWGARDAIVSPTINLYGRSTATLEIDYAYRRATQSESDSLIIKASLDGGQTFPITLFSNADDGNYSVATYVLLNGEFVPNGVNDWCGVGPVGADCLSFDISQYISAPDFRIRFENFSRNGNNFYIDNVRVTSDCISTSVVPQADFNAERMGCNTFTTTFNDNSIGVATSWDWSFPGGTPSSSTERSPEVTYDAPGVYEVSLTVSNSAGSNTETKMDYIVVSDQTPSAGFDLSVSSWNSVIFSNTSTDGVEYVWDFGDGTTSNMQNPSHIFAEVGQSYDVMLTVTNGCGMDTYTETILTTSNDDFFTENASFTVFPNPNEGSFTIEIGGKANQNVDISVYDILGRVVYASNDDVASDKWNKEIRLDNQLNPGTYIVRVDIDGSGTYEKIIVR